MICFIFSSLNVDYHIELSTQPPAFYFHFARHPGQFDMCSFSVVTNNVNWFKRMMVRFRPWYIKAARVLYWHIETITFYQINGRYTSQLPTPKKKRTTLFCNYRVENVLTRATTKISSFFSLSKASCQIHAYNCFKVCAILSNSLLSKDLPQLFDCWKNCTFICGTWTYASDLNLMYKLIWSLKAPLIVIFWIARLDIPRITRNHGQV
jgi:hypothetical protein